MLVGVERLTHDLILRVLSDVIEKWEGWHHAGWGRPRQRQRRRQVFLLHYPRACDLGKNFLTKEKSLIEAEVEVGKRRMCFITCALAGCFLSARFVFV